MNEEGREKGFIVHAANKMQLPVFASVANP